MQEILTLMRERKVECLVGFMILLVAVGVGFYLAGIVEAGRNGLIGFYLGFTGASLVLFSGYITVERLLGVGKFEKTSH